MDKCKKEKQPAPGQYKIVKSLKEQDKERKENARRKRTYQDRITYLDGVQYEATLTPGVGKYNTRVRVHIYLYSPNHQELLEKINQKTGGKNIQNKAKRSHKNTLIWVHITPEKQNHLKESLQKKEFGIESKDFRVRRQRLALS